MRDKTWGERLEDAVETAANAMGLLSLIAVILTAVWAVTYCWVNHITVRDIGHTIKSFVDDGKGDEVGFVKAMRAEGYTESANDALDAGHTICSRLRSDGSTPTDVVNWFEANRPAGLTAAIVRKMTFTLVTNSQVYLCPDTLHNTGTPTPTTVTATPAPTAPLRGGPGESPCPGGACEYPRGPQCPAHGCVPTPAAPPPQYSECPPGEPHGGPGDEECYTPPTPTAPPTMVATTAPASFQYVPLWPFASQQEADRWLRDDAPNGHLPWHAEEDTTALYFTQNYLGFTEINQTTNVTTKGNEAWVSVGYELPNLKVMTALRVRVS